MVNSNVVGFEYFETIDFKLRSVIDVASEANLPKDDVELLLKNGLKKIPVADEDLPGIISEALQKLEKKICNSCNDIKIIFLLHSVSGMILENKGVLATCAKGTIFEEIPIVPISGQPCAIFHFGIQLAQKILQENDTIILLGVDIAQSAKQRFFFGSAMGDSVIYGNLKCKDVVHNVNASLSETYIIADNGKNSSESAIQQFRGANSTFIRNIIDTILVQASIGISEIDWFIPHTPYLKMQQILSDVLNIPNDKLMMDYISETAHLNSNDTFCHYLRGCKEGKISKTDICMLINPGFGGTRGVTILQYGKRI